MHAAMMGGCHARNGKCFFSHRAAAERAAALEAALARAQAEAAASGGEARELRARVASLEAMLAAARAERNALNAAIRWGICCCLQKGVRKGKTCAARQPCMSIPTWWGINCSSGWKLFGLHTKIRSAE